MPVSLNQALRSDFAGFTRPVRIDLGTFHRRCFVHRNGKGKRGEAAQKQETMIVDDIRQQHANYISKDSRAMSVQVPAVMTASLSIDRPECALIMTGSRDGKFVTIFDRKDKLGLQDVWSRTNVSLYRKCSQTLANWSRGGTTRDRRRGQDQSLSLSGPRELGNQWLKSC